jgi:hypothetical protein
MTTNLGHNSLVLAKNSRLETLQKAIFSAVTIEGAMRSFDLKIYPPQYDAVVRRRFERTYDLKTLDPLSNDLRDGKALTIEHVNEVFSEKNSHFGQFWKIPESLERKLKGQKIYLQMPDQEATEPERSESSEKIVSMLFKLLGSIDLASILLRCVHPREFGVYSPPLLGFLQLELEPGGPVSHYLDYCGELREWGKHFGIQDGGVTSVGETDKALWVFYEIAYGPMHFRDAKVHQDRFRNDKWIVARRAEKFLRAFFSRFEPLEQARLMAEIQPNLAAKIAGCELERLVITLLDPDVKGEKTWRDNVNAFADLYPGLTSKKDLHRACDLRNSAIHGTGRMTANDVLDILKVAVDISAVPVKKGKSDSKRS